MEIGCEPLIHTSSSKFSPRAKNSLNANASTPATVPSSRAGRALPRNQRAGPTERFEYYLYQRIVKLIENNAIFVTESAENKRLEDDLIPKTEVGPTSNRFESTIRANHLYPASRNTVEKHDELTSLMAQVASRIHAGSNSFVVPGQRKPEDFIWHLANRRWKDDLKTGLCPAGSHEHHRHHAVCATTDRLSGCVFKPAVTRKQNAGQARPI